MLIEAIREYHFTDRAREIVENRRQFHSRIAAAIAGLKALEGLISDQAIVNRFGTLQFHSKSEIPILDVHHKNRIETLAQMQSTHVDSMYPIARLDDTAKERLFVFRMARANERCFGKAKSALIANLMELEGFKSRLDERTIERQCAALDRKKRQLFDELDATSVGAVDTL
jgi:hypothetical protein